MVATARNGGEVRGLDERLRRFGRQLAGWSVSNVCRVLRNYAPGVYGIARALLASRETDEAFAAA